MATEKKINNFIINKIENEQVYEYMVQNNLINEDELYLIQDIETQVDWNENDESSSAYIKNKPNVATQEWVNELIGGIENGYY